MPECGPTVLHRDNLSCIQLTETVQRLRNAKHVGTCYHHVRDLVQRPIISVDDICSDCKKAHALTKILGRVVHVVHFRFLGFAKF